MKYLNVPVLVMFYTESVITRFDFTRSIFAWEKNINKVM